MTKTSTPARLAFVKVIATSPDGHTVNGIPKKVAIVEYLGGHRESVKVTGDYANEVREGAIVSMTIKVVRNSYVCKGVCQANPDRYYQRGDFDPEMLARINATAEAACAM